VPSPFDRMAGRRWVKAVCSVIFDTDKGQTIEECFPPDAVRVSIAATKFGPWCLPLRLGLVICVSSLCMPQQLSEDELQKVCNLALPESNTGALGDSIHTFRMRTYVLLAVNAS
jgi:hypothetical protein